MGEPIDKLISTILGFAIGHGLLIRRFFGEMGRTVRWAEVVKFDALYYAGVVAMVGFWLSMGQVTTSFILVSVLMLLL
ncbi:hypothetical protein [Pseudomonas prosekii]|uniref:hypothetical protein n=1 Tax=Pseudomonas prosekii TaxID=1148509 RepID=UPI0011EAECCA|nr:hypothetical protein [Pseudomonas prosekii]